MKLNNGFFAIVMLSGSLLSASCNKKESAAPQPVCGVSKITGSNGTTTTAIRYNTAGQIVRVSFGGGAERIYTYDNSKVVYMDEIATNSANNKKYRLTLNASGLIAKVEIPDPGNNWVSYAEMSYDAAGNISQVAHNNPAAPTTHYTYQNGNLITQTAGTTVYNYSYDDKPSKDGDYLYYAQILTYGLPYLKSRNTVTGLSFGNVVEAMSYEYDASGKIKKMTITINGSPVTVSYEYDCK